MERFNYVELKIIFRNISRIAFIGLIARGRKAWQEEETRKGTSIVLIHQVIILYFRALQGHLGRNFIDPFFTRQCGDWDWNIPLHLPHWVRIQSSFYYQQWIDTWRSRLEKRTSKNTSYNWMRKIFLADQRQKQNHKEENLPALHQE